MQDYEYLFVTNLHQKLKEKVKGGVYTNVTENDELCIKISNGDLVYGMRLSNLSDKIINGWSTDYAVHEILESYKRFINKTYFRYVKRD